MIKSNNAFFKIIFLPLAFFCFLAFEACNKAPAFPQTPGRPSGIANQNKPNPSHGAAQGARQNPYSHGPPRPSLSSYDQGRLKCLPPHLNEYCKNPAHSKTCNEYILKFYNGLRGFLSTTIDPKTVPFIKCTDRKDLKGGVFIQGRVETHGALFDPNSSSQELEVSENSHLDILIYDNHNRKYAGIKMRAIPYGGSISGKFVTLAFEDSKGKVNLEGTVANGLFSAKLSYENYVTFDGSPSNVSGEMGRFSLSACRLFVCRSSGK